MTVPHDPGLARAELEARLLELTSLLEAEYDAIRERDTGELARIADAKQSLVERINAAAGAADVTTLLDERNPAGEHLHTLMVRCAQANRINGAAIESSQSFTTSLLDILRGRVPGERTYTSRGRLGAQIEAATLVRV